MWNDGKRTMSESERQWVEAHVLARQTPCGCDDGAEWRVADALVELRSRRLQPGHVNFWPLIMAMCSKCYRAVLLDAQAILTLKEISGGD